MDDFLFSPIGYSMNGIMEEVAQTSESCANSQSSEEHKDPSFMTIHVTPQVRFAIFHPVFHLSISTPIPAQLQLCQL